MVIGEVVVSPNSVGVDVARTNATRFRNKRSTNLGDSDRFTERRTAGRAYLSCCHGSRLSGNREHCRDAHRGNVYVFVFVFVFLILVDVLVFSFRRLNLIAPSCDGLVLNVVSRWDIVERASVVSTNIVADIFILVVAIGSFDFVTVKVSIIIGIVTVLGPSTGRSTDALLLGTWGILFQTTVACGIVASPDPCTSYGCQGRFISRLLSYRGRCGLQRRVI